MEHLNIRSPMFLVLASILVTGIISNMLEQFLRAGFISPYIVTGFYGMGLLGFWYGTIYADEKILEKYEKDSLVRFEVLREIIIPTKNPLQASFTMLLPAFLITCYFPRNLWNF